MNINLSVSLPSVLSYRGVLIDTSAGVFLLHVCTLVEGSSGKSSQVMRDADLQSQQKKTIRHPLVVVLCHALPQAGIGRHVSLFTVCDALLPGYYR